jgi:molybdopterin biosynthesis enzyme
VLAAEVGGREDAACMVAVRLEAADGALRAVPLARRAGALRALAGADAYIVVPPGPGLEAGAAVTALRLRDR